ncbi:Ca2+:H+ antiporter [Saccharopolyspora kobensis]|uniref:Ca2+:H+ antiporter n=1 Tax=Saccharopolyspora kobensis TaxID=146035 RepID=A0A1H5UFW8_9PSEU|nr:calcium:proton antiporter [Saccharopolyspora kobensis]SEF73889.1 Ca2+:H+ antiporter [Saccharopolyspora kobensis]SFC73889.1 Ca2+:H+ antiporter [Saccharopolyspora kobensis]
MRTASTHRTVITPAVIFRLLLGWGAFAGVLLAEPVLSAHLPGPALIGVLAGIIAVIVVCAFGVVTQAEHLAHRLGDPYGTLVLTLSIVLIEVVLISAVMLGPGEHATIARDSVMAVSMIIMNLVIGVALLVGGTRHDDLEPNRTGVSAYLSLLVVLSTLAFALPGLIGTGGAYRPAQAIPVIALTVLLYAYFLHRQMGEQRADFQEVSASPGADEERPAISEVLSKHRSEIVLRAVVLVLTVVPIVLLSHDMAALLDDGLGRAGAPVALSGILIAMIVFLPETITAVRAAHTGEIQRVSNLCHGALVSTVGLTIPAVLTIGLLTGQTVVLAESPANLVLLGITMLLSITTFAGKKVTPLHGAAHLLVFLVYGLAVFS